MKHAILTLAILAVTPAAFAQTDAPDLLNELYDVQLVNEGDKYKRELFVASTSMAGWKTCTHANEACDSDASSKGWITFRRANEKQAYVVLTHNSIPQLAIKIDFKEGEDDLALYSRALTELRKEGEKLWKPVAKVRQPVVSRKKAKPVRRQSAAATPVATAPSCNSAKLQKMTDPIGIIPRYVQRVANDQKNSCEAFDYSWYNKANRVVDMQLKLASCDWTDLKVKHVTSRADICGLAALALPNPDLLVCEDRPDFPCQ